MPNPVISVENLSKVYRLGQIGTGTLTNDLKVWWAKVRGKPNPALRIGETDYSHRDGQELWALKDISFTVEQGEVLGIIGRNGAGKTTLLKILSRVTAPSRGVVKVKGRIASLLEVGTGFHPELTGRENVFLNGAILGMTRAEVQRKFDEIVAFAEIEQFIDTPVKRYSSGMYVRLAFAVAAHLEPEILLVDEVLAVGDAEFQKKCLGKMGDVASEGRTVLYVSHNLLQLRNLCEQSLWIERGVLKGKGISNKIISEYSKWTTHINNDQMIGEINDGFLSWSILGKESGENNLILSDKSFTIELLVKDSQEIFNGSIIFILQNSEGEKIAGWHRPGLKLKPGLHRILFKFSSFPIRSDVYYWNAALWDGSRLIDSRIILPEMVISTHDHSNLDRKYAGIVNVPCIIEVQ